MGRDGEGFLSWLKPLVALKRRVLQDIFYPRCVASGLCKAQGGQAGLGGWYLWQSGIIAVVFYRPFALILALCGRGRCTPAPPRVSGEFVSGNHYLRYS